MARDCLIEFKPNGAQLEVKISAKPLGSDGKKVVRRSLHIPLKELNQLRAGNPDKTLVQKLSTQVSQWLQHPDLDLAQILELNGSDEESWRLVFSVPDRREQKLRFDLANIPLELITVKQDTTPFALHNRVSAIVHLRPKVASVRALSGITWPLRILIVRSSPKDLHVTVPQGLSILDTILELRPDLVQGERPQIEVDILSHEDHPKVAGKPTREKLMAQLAFGYDMLVYLGHGDVAEIQDDGIPIGQLLLETDDGLSDRVDARNLSNLLHSRPVPVVLLVGCLTAADLPPEIQDEVEKEIPKWLQGSQGVAQALINNLSGVEFVVGMRYRIEAKDAILFLNAFFESLLVDKSDEHSGNRMGNLELAVREARRQLSVLGQQSISWAAPMLLRSGLRKEPSLPFLSSPPLYQIKPELQQVRTIIWETLAELNWSIRSASTRIVDMLQDIEDKICNDVQENQAVLLMPHRVEIDPNQIKTPPENTEIDLVVELHDSLTLREVQGTLVEGSGIAHFLTLEPSTPVLDAGFEFWLSPPDHNQIHFLIRQPEKVEATLPKGPLFHAKLAIGDAIQVVYPLNLTNLKAEPHRALCPGNNAIIVPPP